VSRRKSLAITAAGILSVVALLAGCVPAPLTDVHKILTNAQTTIKNLQSVHFHLEAGGEYVVGLVGSPSPEPTPSPTETPTPSPSPTPSPTSNVTLNPSASAAAASASAAAASASASASAAAASASASAADASASASGAAASAAEASASASAAAASPAASVTPVPTPTPYFIAQPLSLKGAVADGDIDFANNAAHVVGGLPGLPGFSGELIVVGSVSYLRPYGATKYTQDSVEKLRFSPADPTVVLYVVQQAVALANDQGLVPKFIGMESEPGGTCYHIRVGVSQSALNSHLASLQAVVALGSGSLDLWFTEGDFQLERLEFSTSGPDTGTAAIRLVLSNWNSISPIEAPADNQLQSPSAAAAY
jgi:hypothetical protein